MDLAEKANYTAVVNLKTHLIQITHDIAEG